MGTLQPENMISYEGIADKDEFPVYPLVFKQFTIIEDIDVPCEKPSIEDVNKVIASIQLKETKIIKSPYDIKLLVSGYVKQRITYTAYKPEQPVHQFHFDMPFCELIILNDRHLCTSKINVFGFIEDIHVFHIEKIKIKICKVICLCITKKCCY